MNEEKFTEPDLMSEESQEDELEAEAKTFISLKTKKWGKKAGVLRRIE